MLAGGRGCRFSQTAPAGLQARLRIAFRLPGRGAGGECFGERGGEPHFGAGDRMREFEERGVQAEASGRVRFGLVFFVSDDRAALGGELDSDLVATAGFQAELDQRAALIFPENFVGGNGSGMAY